MFCNLKCKVLGNYVKVISLKLKTSNRIKAYLDRNINKDKLQNNLIRAKNKINELALANSFEWFVTITFNPKYDRYNLDELMLLFRSTLRKMRKLNGEKIQYLIVPEQHKDGAWHFHGLFDDGISNFLFFNDNGFRDIAQLNSLGYVNVTLIRDKIKASSYITKYVAKNLGNGIRKFNHCYYASVGLKTGYDDLDIIYNDVGFNNAFFDYSNDWCCLKTITLEDYQVLKEQLKKWV